MPHIPPVVRRRPAGHLLAALLAASLAVLGSTLTARVASAAEGDVGFQGPSTAGASTTVGTHLTGQKPESKLWWNDGRWWADLWEPTSQQWRLSWLDRSATPESWVYTDLELDDRASSRADILSAGNTLYVASHVFASDSTTHVAKPSRLYRYSYDSTQRMYHLDVGFPVQVGPVSSETMVLDRDAAGRLWVTWTQDDTVYVNATVTPGDDATWGTPFALPVEAANTLKPDDIATLVQFRGQIGVMWSNQNDSAVHFSVHQPGDPVGTWSPSVTVTVPGAGQADDHLNIKSIEGDSTGRVFAVIKTSLDAQGPSAPAIVVLARSATGQWSRATFGTFGDCHTRPILMLDGTAGLVHVYATAPDSGCDYSGSNGSIFEKISPLDNLSFAPGRGTPVMRDALSPHLNDVTGSKQTVTSTTGIVLLSSNDDAHRYWFSDEPITAGGSGASSPPAPAPSPSPSPSPAAAETVTVPLQVDTYVSSAKPGANYGHAGVLQVGAQPIQIGYLKYNLSGYTGTVVDAVLRVPVGADGSAGSTTVRLVADSSWKETKTTYRNRPALGSVLGTLSAPRSNTISDVPLSSAAVQGALGGTLSLGLASTSSDDVSLLSRETGTGAQLVLTLQR